jgi:hypothetical protein
MTAPSESRLPWKRKNLKKRSTVFPRNTRAQPDPGPASPAAGTRTGSTTWLWRGSGRPRAPGSAAHDRRGRRVEDEHEARTREAVQPHQ